MLRANQAWAPHPDNDPDRARRCMRAFYRLVADHHCEEFDVDVAARLEVDWWRIHRELQHGGDPLASAPLVDALAAALQPRLRSARGGRPDGRGRAGRGDARLRRLGRRRLRARESTDRVRAGRARPVVRRPARRRPPGLTADPGGPLSSWPARPAGDGEQDPNGGGHDGRRAASGTGERGRRDLLRRPLPPVGAARPVAGDDDRLHRRHRRLGRPERDPTEVRGLAVLDVPGRGGLGGRQPGAVHRRGADARPEVLPDDPAGRRGAPRGLLPSVLHRRRRVDRRNRRDGRRQPDRPELGLPAGLRTARSDGRRAPQGSVAAEVRPGDRPLPHGRRGDARPAGPAFHRGSFRQGRRPAGVQRGDRRWSHSTSSGTSASA